MTSPSRNFREVLEAQWGKGKFLCVGLDSDFDKIPESIRQHDVRETLVAFNRAIIDATGAFACAFKLNSAFYEPHGDEGWNAMRETIQYILETVPEALIIYDGKRADIGNTNNGYVAAAFDHLRADAITVQPYAGRAALEPFLAQKDKGIIVWCRSSNEGAGEFQDLIVEGEPLYIRVARNIAEEWNERGNCMLVVGATYPEEIAKVRAVAPEIPFLIPGIGAQGGDLEKTVVAAKDERGRGMVISASRSVIFASRGNDFAEAAGKAACELDAAIRRAL